MGKRKTRPWIIFTVVGVVAVLVALVVAEVAGWTSDIRANDREIKALPKPPGVISTRFYGGSIWNLSTDESTIAYTIQNSDITVRNELYDELIRTGWVDVVLRPPSDPADGGLPADARAKHIKDPFCSFHPGDECGRLDLTKERGRRTFELYAAFNAGVDGQSLVYILSSQLKPLVHFHLTLLAGSH